MATGWFARRRETAEFYDRTRKEKMTMQTCAFQPERARRGVERLFGAAAMSNEISSVEDGPTSLARRVWREVRSLKLRNARERDESAEQLMIASPSRARNDAYADLWAIRAMTLALEDDTLSASAAAEQSLRQPDSGDFGRLAGLVLRFCAWKAGSATPSGAQSALLSLSRPPSDMSPSSHVLLADVLDLTLAGAIELTRLQAAAAERLARYALRRAEATPTATALPASLLARILYERGEMTLAQDLLMPRLALIRRTASLDCIQEAYTVLARTSAHAGDFAAAHALLVQASQIAEERNWPRLLAAMLAERVRLADRERADIWLEQLSNLAARSRFSSRCARSEIACRHFRAQVDFFLKFQAGEVPWAAIAQLRHDAWLANDALASLWTKLAEAQLLWWERREDKSLQALADVLRTAEATGLRQCLFDAGPLLPAMLEKLLADPLLGAALLAFAFCILEDVTSRVAPKSQPVSKTMQGGDRLSLREREVLRLIGEGHTNKSIAQLRGVAPETVKTQVKNIFIKLGVERRAQAVAKAERLGIVQ